MGPSRDHLECVPWKFIPSPPHRKKKNQLFSAINQHFGICYALVKQSTSAKVHQRMGSQGFFFLFHKITISNWAQNVKNNITCTKSWILFKMLHIIIKLISHFIHIELFVLLKTLENQIVIFNMAENLNRLIIVVGKIALLINGKLFLRIKQ